MKKKLFTLCAACLMAFTLTGCDGKEVTPEVAQAKLANAEEAAEDYLGANLTLKSTLDFDMSVKYANGDNTTDVFDSSANAKTNIKAGYVLNEDKTALAGATFNETSNCDVAMNALGSSYNMSYSDTGDYTYSPDTKALEGSSTVTDTDGNKETSTSAMTTAEFTALIQGSCLCGGFSASASFSLEGVLNAFTATYGDPTYYTSFGNYSAKYELEDTELLATAGVTAYAGEDTYTASVLANLKVKNAYVKFTFNEKATKVAIEVNINVSGTGSFNEGLIALNSELSLKYNLKTSVDLTNSL